MRDYQEVILKFVKIVERYPEVYDPRLDTYRTRHADAAWEQIAVSVRTELDEECTVDEIKLKWKGIRSSFNRFKNKLYSTNLKLKAVPRKKYYLYDSLKFLEPHIKSKGINTFSTRENLGECGNCTNSDDDDKTPEHYDLEMDGWQIKIKSELPGVSNDALNTSGVLNLETEDTNPSSMDHQIADALEPSKSDYNKVQKRKFEDTASNDNSISEDLQFFKSILPDIKNFSTKEKRKLKMGILTLIDEIEDSRKQSEPSLEVTSTKFSS